MKITEMVQVRVDGCTEVTETNVERNGKILEEELSKKKGIFYPVVASRKVLESTIRWRKEVRPHHLTICSLF